MVIAGLAFIAGGIFFSWYPLRLLKAYKLLDDFSGM